MISCLNSSYNTITLLYNWSESSEKSYGSDYLSILSKKRRIIQILGRLKCVISERSHCKLNILEKNSIFSGSQKYMQRRKVSDLRLEFSHYPH